MSWNAWATVSVLEGKPRYYSGSRSKIFEQERKKSARCRFLGSWLKQ